MSLRLETSTDIQATPSAIWARLTDWAGQSDWIPLTTVTVLGTHSEGVGVKASALSGTRLGRLPLGLVDRFVVTGWTPPVEGVPGELEVLHLGPCFTGPGVFRVEDLGGGRSRVSCTEVFDLPGGRPVEAAAGLLLPVMRAGLQSSLRTMGRLVEAEGA